MRIKLKEYTRADCPSCGEPRVVYAKGITPCSDCGELLFPCNACQECLYDACPYDGKTFGELNAYMNEPIPKDVEAKVLRKLDRQLDRSIRWMKVKFWFKTIFAGKEDDDLPF